MMVSMDGDGCVEATTRMFRMWVAGLCVLAVVGLISTEARADDWAVESGDDREQRIIERYRTMLEENPVEGMALERLLGHVGRGAGLDGLIAHYERRVDQRPQAQNLRLVLGHLLKARGDHDAALEQYDRAVEIDGDDSLGWLSRGTMRLLMGDRREAMEDFEEALARERDDERRREILQELGELSFSEREFDRGIEFFDELIAESPRDRYLRMEYASLLVQYRQFDEAIEQYDVLLRLVSGDPRRKATMLRDMADVYEMMGDLEAALEAYEEVKSLVRSDSWLAREVRQQIVDVYRQAGRLDDFLDDYGSRWQRGDTEQQMFVADVHVELGKLEEALEQYRALARRDARSVEPREKSIRVLERLGRDDELDAAYRDLMRAAPRDPKYAFELAEHYMQIGDRDEARGVLAEVGQRFSGRSYVLLQLADHYARWNFVEQARQTYETVLSREGDDDAVLIDVGDFYFDRGNRQRALEVWRKLPDSRLGREDGSRRKAELLVERGVMTEGIAIFERLIEESPTDERLLRSMARALERARHWDDALERWGQLLEVTDDAGRKREARSRIIELYERSQRLRARMRDWRQTFDGGDGEGVVDAGFFLAEAHLRLRETDEAGDVLRTLEESYELSDDEYTSVLLGLERIYVRAERYEEAIDVLERLAEHEPTMRAEALERKTSHALEARIGDRAVEFASRSTTANPNDAAAHERLGDVHRELGEREAAMRHYRTATDIDTRAHDVYLKMGGILIAEGRFSEAEDALMTVIEEATETQLIRDAGAKMLSMADAQGRLETLEVQWTPLMFRMPIHDAHARLMFDLYDLLVGPLLLNVYHGDAEERNEARQRLFELGGRAAPLLVEQLQRDSTAARVRALRMVAEMEVDLAAPQVARLIGDDDERLRSMAIATAARLGDERFLEPLENSVGDGSASVRHLAIWALGFVDDRRAKKVLREVADTDVVGPDSLMARLGLWGGEDAAAHRIVGDGMRRLIDDPAGMDRDRAAVLLAVAATMVSGGGGEDFRGVAAELARESTGRVGGWAARLIGTYDDVEASTELWTFVLSGDASLARRGELGLLEMANDAPQLERQWDEEVRHFDWSEAQFDATALLRHAGRRWSERSGPATPERWSDTVEAGLEAALREHVEAVDVEAVLSRIARQSRGESSRLWWNEGGMRRFVEQLGEAPLYDDLDESVQMSVAILAGDGDVVVGDVSERDDDELITVMDALAMTDAAADDELVLRVYGEALQRSKPQVRREALRNLEWTVGTDSVDEVLAGPVIDALYDEDRAVQLAAVRTAGHLRLRSALDVLDGLEEEAPPALRRAVRQTRRLLEDE